MFSYCRIKYKIFLNIAKAGTLAYQKNLAFSVSQKIILGL